MRIYESADNSQDYDRLVALQQEAQKKWMAGAPGFGFGTSWNDQLGSDCKIDIDTKTLEIEFYADGTHAGSFSVSGDGVFLNIGELRQQMVDSEFTSFLQKCHRAAFNNAKRKSKSADTGLENTPGERL